MARAPLFTSFPGVAAGCAPIAFDSPLPEILSSCRPYRVPHRGSEAGAEGGSSCPSLSAPPWAAAEDPYASARPRHALKRLLQRRPWLNFRVFGCGGGGACCLGRRVLYSASLLVSIAAMMSIVEGNVQATMRGRGEQHDGRAAVAVQCLVIFGWAGAKQKSVAHRVPLPGTPIPHP